MRVTILGSGSRGNSTLVEGGGARLLVDAGLSPKEVERRAEKALGEPLGRIDALVLTHAHGDHVGHARPSAAHFDAPVFMTEATRRNADLGSLPHTRVFGPRAHFSIGALEVRPHPVPHDAPQVALVFAAEERRAALVTDLGWVHRELLEHLRGVGTLFIEANHEPALLATGPYPPEIQKRIASGAGHLSNHQMAEALEALAPGLERVVLMHLSQANNEPHLARRAAERALSREPGVQVQVAHQDEALQVDVGPPRGQLSLGIPGCA
jgi:phosphoribosyl 1,2-cyclic phosphodiesterase